MKAGEAGCPSVAPLEEKYLLPHHHPPPHSMGCRVAWNQGSEVTARGSGKTARPGNGATLGPETKRDEISRAPI